MGVHWERHAEALLMVADSMYLRGDVREILSGYRYEI